jgi:hypothetical protein
MRIEDLELKVYRTIRRHDDRGEFIIRLPPQVKRHLPPGCQYVVVRTKCCRLEEADGKHSSPEVIAAVRGLAKHDDKLQLGDDELYCQLDMSLRVAVGAMGFDPGSGSALRDNTGSARKVTITPLNRCICPAIVPSWVGFQWMLFRVHRSLTGDFETPICRVEPRFLASLGIHDGGVVVIESVEHRAVRRVLGFGEGQTAELEVDFENALGVDESLRMPPIYMDKSARDQLRVVPGQAVWVRRETGAVFRLAFLKAGSSLALAFLGILFSFRDWTWSVTDCMFALVAMILVVAVLYSAIVESRDQVRAD